MAKILLVGQRPETVDFSDPSLPPDLTAAKIQAGIDTTLADMRARGWDADFCAIAPDATAGRFLEAQLGAKRYDCVVIGGGIRIPEKNLLLFEILINAVHTAAPHSAIAFNTRPENSADAAARWIG